MADKDSEDGGGLPESEIPVTEKKQHGLFGASGIQLTEEELSSTATTKFLRHMNSSQENDIQKLRSFESQFFDKRQECEVLKKEKEGIQRELDAKKTLENAQKAMITVGSLILGSLKLLESAEWYIQFLLGLVAAFLILAGMFPVLRIGGSK